MDGPDLSEMINEQEVYKLKENSVQFKILSEHVKRTIGCKGYREDFEIVNIFQIKNTSVEDAFYENILNDE